MEKPTIVRENDRVYLCLTAPAEEEESFEVRMLMENFLPELIPVQIRRLDLTLQQYYELQDWIPVGSLFGSERVTGKEIRWLMEGFKNLCRTLEEYLLDLDHIYCAPEYIFTDWERSRLRFIYSLSPADFTGGLRQLFSFLLDHVNYEDQDCVRLVYSLYQTSLRENASLAGLFKVYEEAGSLSLPVFCQASPVVEAEKEVVEVIKEKKEKGTRGFWDRLMKGKEKAGKEGHYMLVPVDKRKEAEILLPMGDFVIESLGCTLSMGEEGLWLLTENSPAEIWVNGELLPLFERRGLSPGDHVMLAGKEYLVERRE